MRLNPVQGIAAAGVLIAAALFFLPITPLDQQTARIAALTLMLITLWATNTLPPFLSVLIFFALATIFRVIPPDLVFSGFAAGAFWLVFGGLVIGAAVRQTGLAARVAHAMVARFGTSYRMIIAGVILLGVGLSFLVPSSMGRVLMLVPIAIALADRYQFASDANGRFGLVLAMTFGAHLPSFGIMPANVPNMLLVGTIESVWGVVIQYGSYLLLHFPVIGILKATMIYVLIITLFPDQLPDDQQNTDTQPEPMSAAEKRLTAVMMIVLGLWATDFLHGISPAWVALGAAAVLLMPRIGVVSQDTFNKGISYSSLIFVAGVISLAAMIAQSELNTIIAAQAERWLPLAPGRDAANFFTVSLTAMTISVFGTIPTVPAIMVPLSDVLAQMSGLSMMAVFMLQVVGFSTPLFPYQAPPLLVGVLLGEVPMSIAIRFSLLLALLTVVILMPLDILWWMALGQF